MKRILFVLLALAAAMWACGGSTTAELTYTVTNTSGETLISYTNATGGIEQHTVGTREWVQTFTVDTFTPASLTAQSQGTGAQVTCSIAVNGEIVAESSSSGDYVVVSCAELVQ